MGLISSRETDAQNPATPTHNDNNADAQASALASAPITSVKPATTIKRNASPSKSLHSNGRTPQQIQNHHVRTASIRSRAALAMPDTNELDTQFARILVRSSSTITHKHIPSTTSPINIFTLNTLTVLPLYSIPTRIFV